MMSSTPGAWPVFSFSLTESMQVKRSHRLGIDWWSMKTTQSSGTRPDHPTVAGTLEFKSNGKAIAIAFTEQPLSPHAGRAVFWGWLHRLDWRKRAGLGAAASAADLQ